MSNLNNYTAWAMCEYQSLFPTVASVLNQLLFVIGNGYDVNPNTGLLVGDRGEHLHEMKKMSQGEWEKILAKCYAKERDFNTQMREMWGQYRAVSEKLNPRDFDAELIEACAKYKIVEIDDSMFTEQALYNDLVNMQADRRTDPYWRGESAYLRPYPLSEDFCDVYKLTQDTPLWMLQIAYNFCASWTRFLTEAVANNDVFETDDKHNYADMHWTKTHRDMIAWLTGRFHAWILMQTAHSSDQDG